MSRTKRTGHEGVTRAVVYLRVSTGEQRESGLGLDAQRTACRHACQARGWQILSEHEDAGISAKSLSGRPALAAALEELRAGRADVLVVAKLDRLARSTFDAAGLLRRAEREGWAVFAGDVGLDPSTPVGSLVSHIMAAVAEWERRIISERTKAALAEKRAQGVTLGRPRVMDAQLVRRIVSERADGASMPAIARGLNSDGVPTAHGGRQWYPSTVERVLQAVARATVTV